MTSGPADSLAARCPQLGAGASRRRRGPEHRRSRDQRQRRVAVVRPYVRRCSRSSTPATSPPTTPPPTNCPASTRRFDLEHRSDIQTAPASRAAPVSRGTRWTDEKAPRCRPPSPTVSHRSGADSRDRQGDGRRDRPGQRHRPKPGRRTSSTTTPSGSPTGSRYDRRRDREANGDDPTSTAIDDLRSPTLYIRARLHPSGGVSRKGTLGELEEAA